MVSESGGQPATRKVAAPPYPEQPSASCLFADRVTDPFDYDALALAEQSAGIGVWSIDLLTGTVRATAQFFRIMGLEPTSEPIPVDVVRALRHPEDRERVRSGFRHALEGGSDSYEIEYRIIRPDGNQRWIFGRGRVVRDADGRPVRYSGVDLDITDRKAAESALAAAKDELERMNQVLEHRVRQRTEELEAEAQRRAEAEATLYQAQKMEAVGQLTGGIAHDFNNILQVIVGNMEIARIAIERGAVGENNPSRELLVRAVETVQRASRNAKQLVDRLLAFSRRQPLQPMALDIPLLIAEMAHMLRTTLGESFVVDTAIAPGLWAPFADRNQLENALLNLAVNARDAMPSGGRILVEAANVEVGAELPDDLAPGQYVLLSVSDGGCGIAPEHLDRVFEPFFTTKDAGKGSGLGLSMIYGFVKQSGGHVRIYSEVGAGTTVKLFLPRAVQGERPVHVSVRSDGDKQPPAVAVAGETVLLVEDNDDVRRHGIAALESLGYRVLQAADAASAMALFSSPDASRVDLLFTDIVLPGGVNGNTLANNLRAQRAGLPVLFASGYTRNVLAADLELDGRLLSKPYSIDRLAREVRQAIDEARLPKRPST